MTDKPQFKFSAYRLISSTGVCGLFFMVVAMGGGESFVNGPAMLVTYGVPFLLLLGSFQKDFLRFIPASLKCLAFTPLQPNPCYAEIAKFAARYVIGAGSIFALMGLIQMLVDMSDPYSIGSGMAIALITPFYALLASEFFFAFVHKAFSNSGNSDSTPLSTRNVLVPLVVTGFMLGTFMVLVLGWTNTFDAAYVESHMDTPGEHNKILEDTGTSAPDPQD